MVASAIRMAPHAKGGSEDSGCWLIGRGPPSGHGSVAARPRDGPGLARLVEASGILGFASPTAEYVPSSRAIRRIACVSGQETAIPGGPKKRGQQLLR